MHSSKKSAKESPSREYVIKYLDAILRQGDRSEKLFAERLYGLSLNTPIELQGSETVFDRIVGELKKSISTDPNMLAVRHVIEAGIELPDEVVDEIVKHFFKKINEILMDPDYEYDDEFLELLEKFESVSYKGTSLKSYVLDQIAANHLMRARMQQHFKASLKQVHSDRVAFHHKFNMLFNLFADTQHAADVFNVHKDRGVAKLLYDAMISENYQSKSDRYLFFCISTYIFQLEAIHNSDTSFLMMLLDISKTPNSFVRRELITSYLEQKFAQCPEFNLSYRAALALRERGLYPVSDTMLKKSSAQNALLVRGYQFLCAEFDRPAKKIISSLLKKDKVKNSLYGMYLNIIQLPFGVREQIIRYAFPAITASFSENPVILADQLGTREIQRRPFERQLLKVYGQKVQPGTTENMHPRVSLAKPGESSKGKRYRISDH